MATLVTTPIKTFVSGETVTPTKLNELAQSTVALTAGTIVAADIASDAVTTLKILDANVTNAKIASGVDASKLTTGTLPADRIGSSAITTARINDAAVTAAKLDGAQTGSAPIYGCRAWVNFDGTRDTTGAASTANTNRFIRASGNVASVLRNTTGDYTITFTTAMPDANYAWTAGWMGTSGETRTLAVNDTIAPTTSSIRVAHMQGGLATSDKTYLCLAIFR